MEKTKNTSVYLEEGQIKYLTLLSAKLGLTKSALIRIMIDDDMEKNQEFVKTYEEIIFSGFKPFIK